MSSTTEVSTGLGHTRGSTVLPESSVSTSASGSDHAPVATTRIASRTTRLPRTAPASMSARRSASRTCRRWGADTSSCCTARGSPSSRAASTRARGREQMVSGPRCHGRASRRLLRRRTAKPAGAHLAPVDEQTHDTVVRHVADAVPADGAQPGNLPARPGPQLARQQPVIDVQVAGERREDAGQH